MKISAHRFRESMGWIAKRREALFVFGTVVVGVVGLGLVLSAPFDDSARIGLGSALITGLIVGIAVAAIERGIESRRVAAERRREEEQREAMFEVARNRLGHLIAAHTWTYWNLLLEYRDDPKFVMKPPTGFRNDDVRDVHRTLQWLREIMGADQRWWQDTDLLETADALSFVAVDLLERTGFPETLREEDPRLQSLALARERTVERLTGIAQRLAEAGDSQRAFLIDGQLEFFLSPDLPMAIYAPTLDLLETKDGIAWLDRPLSPMRDEVGWIVDQLRPDPIAVNEYGEPATPGAPNPAEYRWGGLLDDGEEGALAWDQRFSPGSWLRRIFDRAGKDLPARFGLESRGALPNLP
ncbi:hypothetical protein [Kitasatospora sp. NPDC005856]|uniref:hypothetical protein n=1 Tax=Kitasatospora sp. NPDC005856 TaxID=3154566 RepID=UPI0033D5FFC4